MLALEFYRVYHKSLFVFARWYLGNHWDDISAKKCISCLSFVWKNQQSQPSQQNPDNVILCFVLGHASAKYCGNHHFHKTSKNYGKRRLKCPSCRLKGSLALLLKIFLRNIRGAKNSKKSFFFASWQKSSKNLIIRQNLRMSNIFWHL